IDFTAEVEGAEGIDPDGKTRWKVPAQASGATMARSGIWGHATGDNLQSFVVHLPDGSVSHTVDVGDALGLDPTTQISARALGDDGSLGVQLMLTEPRSYVIARFGPTGSLLHSITDPTPRRALLRIAVTSEGITAGAFQVGSALPGQTFRGVIDYGMTAMGANGQILWHFQGGGSGRTDVIGFLFTDDSG